MKGRGDKEVRGGELVILVLSASACSRDDLNDGDHTEQPRGGGEAIVY
jgi:hypothetical protein